MKARTTGLVALLLAVSPVGAQLDSRQYTNPVPPSQRALERLNLKMAWRTYLPVTDRRDGIFTVQLLDKQILVQTVAGVVAAVDAATGRIQWKTGIGVPYRITQPLGFNSKWVFAIRGVRLFALDRATGQTAWWYDLPEAPSAGPLADEEGIYLPLGTSRVYAYALPDLELFKRYVQQLAKKRAAEKAREEEARAAEFREGYKETTGIELDKLAAKQKLVQPEPELAWDYLYEEGRLQLTPLQTPEYLLFAASDGSIFSTLKFEREERYRFKAEAAVSAPLGQYGYLAYIASEDYNLYALNIQRGSFQWRFTAGSPILVKPAVTDRDVYVVADRRGLYCLDRATGKRRWYNRDAQRFLAVNTRFVYAFDRHNRMLVLDRNRGIYLGMLPTRDFVFPISNELTDRVFLASHNGLLVCLHDRDQKEPLLNRNIKEKKISGFKPKGMFAKEEVAPKKEEKKAKDKDDDGDKDDKMDKKKDKDDDADKPDKKKDKDDDADKADKKKNKDDDADKPDKKKDKDDADKPDQKKKDDADKE